LLDKILASKGRQAEEKATVYSRVHIAGQSQKAYTIKHRAVHGWDFDHLRDIGVLTKENVEYGNDISGCPHACMQDRGHISKQESTSHVPISKHE